MFAEVVFPLPTRNAFTYSIPDDLKEQTQSGVRVVAPFGKRVLTGFVIGIKHEAETQGKIKPIYDVLDEYPIFDEKSLKFYQWMSDYYLSSIGEALRNSVPYGLEVESKKTVFSFKEICAELFEKEKNKKSLKAQLLRILMEKEEQKISVLQKKLGKKNIYSILKSLDKQGAVTVVDQISEAKVKIKKQLFVKLAKPVDELYDLLPEIEKRSPKQIVILLELIHLKGKDIAQSELLEKTGSSASSVKSLASKGLVEIFEKEVERYYSETYTEKAKDFKLTDAQSKVIKKVSEPLDKSQFKSFLLHGVTGSGKTQVYIELTRKALSQGKDVIILVPEISLTPQITSRFFNIFGEKVAVIHSKISLGERYDAWRGIIKGKYKIVIGPRSALFAPLKNLGLIVVDEEHDPSYKQHEITPKYQARDSAVFLASIMNCPVLLGSATPSIESMYNAQIGKYELLELPERVDNATMPEIKLVNVTIEKKKKKMENIFSHQLLFAIKERLQKKEGVILLQNRRGFATQVYCEDCGEIYMCDECSVSMVHHLKSNSMKCHYCGNIKNVPRACTNCGSLNIKFFGTGTQKVEDELSAHFPEIVIERVDSDTMNKKGRLGQILNSFRKGEIDVLVGTQMVSKGLDFSNVTLVGVISAETTLWLPDFRADERTFQLLTQVAGRAGRSKTKGEVIIQTQDHRHFVLQKVLTNDYADFYTKELNLRKHHLYPPFTKLGLIEIKDEEERNVRGASSDLFKYLSAYKSYITVNPPVPAVIARIKGQWRYQILLKSNKSNDPGGKYLRQAILNSFAKFNSESRFKNVKIFFDIDPQNIL